VVASNDSRQLVAVDPNRASPHQIGHITERYALLTIITLGEGVIGTVTSLVRWSSPKVDAVLVAVAGTGLTFGLWWMYFTVPTIAGPIAAPAVNAAWRDRLSPPQLLPSSTEPSTGGTLASRPLPHRSADPSAHRSALAGALGKPVGRD